MDKRNDNPCTTCNGTGLLRSDNPMSDRIYGDWCSDCNGTGLATNWQARRLAILLFIVLNVLSVVIFVKSCT